MYVAAPACFAADPEPEALEGEAQMDAYLARATARLARADFAGALAGCERAIVGANDPRGKEFGIHFGRNV